MSLLYVKYIDEYMNVHRIDKLLGGGGQGIVFRTLDPDIAIKLVTDKSGNPIKDSESIEKYSRRLKRVRLMPLPEGLNISVPTALLKDHAGYVMQLLSEMVPFSSFWLDGKSAEKITEADIPFWLSEITEYNAKTIVHYCSTGSLRRRLTALYHCSILLARLHGNGLVYGDISPNNIFISEDVEHASVWLIDADNIRFQVSSGGSAVYTPKYGAPELVQGIGCGSFASDCHAFAVVAFELLSLIHPFIGKKVNRMDDGDWADDENDEGDIEEKAYAGLLPWVGDTNDDSNSADGSGLPRQLLLTEKLEMLFQRTFSAGRISPWLRPTIFHWPAALAQAADITIHCPYCEMTFYYDYEDMETGQNKCPYCGALRPESIVFESFRWNGDATSFETPIWRFVREINDDIPIRIPRRLFGEFTMTDSDCDELVISIAGNNILLKKPEGGKIELNVASDHSRNDKFSRMISQIRIERSRPIFRFWIFAVSNDPRLILGTIIGGEK